jgi:S1-C subfamily serine protease
VFGQTATDIAKVAINSTVSIVALDQISQPLGYGSGFIIDDELIATNVHVLEGSNSGYVIKNGDQKKYIIAGYVAIDKENDLVVLKVTGLTGPKLSLGPEALPEIGEKIYAVGNPKGLNGTFSEGIISGIRTITKNQVLQITAPISPGSSGGPVLSTSGKVIGVAFASFTSGQNLNFAIPVKYLALLNTQIAAVMPISTIKAKPKNDADATVSTEVTEGVEIRNLRRSYTTIEFTLKNNLAYTVSDIKILFLIYDKTNEIVDYVESTFFRRSYEGGIKPYLARSIESGSGNTPSINTSLVFSIKARILDFKINEE